MMDNTRFAYEGPAEWLGRLADALRQVVDPEIGLPILDVGLVYGVVLGADLCTVQLTMTSAACPMGDLIVGDVEAALDALLPDEVAIQVTLVWEPPWAPERMSEGARRAMGW